MNRIKTDDILEAKKRIESVVKKTPLEYSKRLSDKYGANANRDTIGLENNPAHGKMDAKILVIIL